MILDNIGRSLKVSGIESESFKYVSQVLKLFFDAMARIKNCQILDAGIMYNQNINFFAKKVLKISTCDLFSRINKRHEGTLPPKDLWNCLDFPHQNFNGILLWDIFDHLAQIEALNLSKICSQMLKPDGIIFLLSYQHQKKTGLIKGFQLEDNFTVRTKALSTVKTPFFTRSTREMLKILYPLSVVKSCLYRTGFKEMMVVYKSS